MNKNLYNSKEILKGLHFQKMMKTFLKINKIYFNMDLYQKQFYNKIILKTNKKILLKLYQNNKKNNLNNL